ncbi:MAG: hypothetical protein KJO42_08380 [Silicimonas sp.]|nr:hypothetical protein [Silicimonas sp.]NNF90033.1 hypothetical protein [Boseongicola sp.]RZW07153.1 MAG: hypothetical protein EX266_06750 [Paracoccaceae bacterium]NND20759.1 hypothetical protein [Silicimonas sp.]NND41972.1 hypothetical protein [Silicimonas sp.]
MRFLLIEPSTVASIDLECILEDLGHTVTAVAVSKRRARQEWRRHRGAIDAAILNAEVANVSARPLIDALNRRGISCAVANAGEKPFTPARVAEMVQRLRAV